MARINGKMASACFVLLFRFFTCFVVFVVIVFPLSFCLLRSLHTKKFVALKVGLGSKDNATENSQRSVCVCVCVWSMRHVRKLCPKVSFVILLPVRRDRMKN